MPRRIGILGGSFDPPHIGHFICARAVAEALGLEKILVVPAARQPHKLRGAYAPDALRLKMLVSVCRVDKLFELCKLEIKRGGVSYTVETLEKLHEIYPPPMFELYLIIGVDAAVDLSSWLEPERIFDLARVVAMERPKSPRLPDEFRDQIIRVTTPRIEVSSTEIRRRVAASLSVAHMTPRPVERLIKKHRLYRD